MDVGTMSQIVAEGKIKVDQLPLLNDENDIRLVKKKMGCLGPRGHLFFTPVMRMRVPN